MGHGGLAPHDGGALVGATQRVLLVEKYHGVALLVVLHARSHSARPDHARLQVAEAPRCLVFHVVQDTVEHGIRPEVQL
eukprot:CAMPEP_0179015788 /NCGR_PEP_ID=MMETSP0796-20121207/2978_1 /TAXON_ID=73915 /ORGANISM="Pyrodinium bahamense, Strain pbaha01" /LENGTH=78 /DNA_ID=CAMNT_0020711445 /DNA_START=1274 /DNA_END=1510 /DNA_ORIENTATION=+